MGFQLYYGELLETDDNSRWVIEGISARRTAQLQRIRTTTTTTTNQHTIHNRNLRNFAPDEEQAATTETENDEEECCTTPTSSQSRTIHKLVCPAPPRKPRSKPSTCHNLFGGGVVVGEGVREFFNPPELESVFTRLVRYR